MALIQTSVAIDLGSSCIRAIVLAQYHNDKKYDDGFHILEAREVESSGILLGAIVDVEKCKNDVVKIINLISRVNFNTIIINISSLSIQGIKSIGATNDVGRINSRDIETAILYSKDYMAFNSNRNICFKAPLSFSIDNKINISNPVGKKAKLLSVDYFAIGVDQKVIDNIDSVIEKSGLNMDSDIVSSVACSQLFLSDKQKHDGVCLLDIGSSVCDMIVFIDGHIVLSAVLPIGGNNINNDIFYNYECSFEESERLKIDCGFIKSNDFVPERLVFFNQENNLDEHMLSNYQLSEIITNSYTKILLQIKQKLKDNNFHNKLDSGIVVIGGASKIQGLRDLMLNIFKTRVHFGEIGITNIVGISKVDNYKYYNALSLLLYKENTDYLTKSNVNKKRNRNTLKDRIMRIIKPIGREFS